MLISSTRVRCDRFSRSRAVEAVLTNLTKKMELIASGPYNLPFDESVTYAVRMHLRARAGSPCFRWMVI